MVGKTADYMEKRAIEQKQRRKKEKRRQKKIKNEILLNKQRKGAKI